MASSVSLRFNLPYIPEIVGPIAHEREEPFFEDDVVAGDGGGIRLDALIEILDFLLELEPPSRALHIATREGALCIRNHLQPQKVRSLLHA